MSNLVNYRARLRAGAVLPLAAVAVLAADRVSPALAKGAPYEVLYNFGSGTDGAVPGAMLMKDKSGNLYGTTSTGGASDGGTVFKITTSGAETVLYSFQNDTDGDDPTDTPIEDSAGNLYGVTIFGGAAGVGKVYKLAPNGTETTLYSFGSFGTDGEYPASDLIADGKGNLYGTTQAGGTYGNGTVFEVAPNGTETVLWSLNSSPQSAGLLTIGHNFYGTTYEGGADRAGTVYELVKGKKGAWTEQVLYSFTGGADGSYPDADLIKDSAGDLYGTTTLGGAYGYGDVFELAPDGTFTVLFTFDGEYGEAPHTGLLLAKNGDLYGTTSDYSYNGQYYGTVFQLAPDGTDTVLHVFTGAPGDGAVPYGAHPLVDIGGYLYGTTYEGGTNNFGTVFKIKE